MRDRYGVQFFAALELDYAAFYDIEILTSFVFLKDFLVFFMGDLSQGADDQFDLLI